MIISITSDSENGGKVSPWLPPCLLKNPPPRSEHEDSEMPRATDLITVPVNVLKQILSVRFLFLISCLSFGVTILWIKSVERNYRYYTDEDLVNEALENVATDFRFYEVYRPPNKLPKYLKYILLWTSEDYAPLYFLEKGQRAFIRNNCSMINCYVTTDRNFFGGDVTKFDAVAFNGRNLLDLNSWNLPRHRSPHQKYIYFNMESADNFPVCSERFDNFFNWTSTYRLDSDIPFGYIMVRDKNEEVVGPRKDMTWVDMTDIDDIELPYVQNKSKAAAWFVSHCQSRSGRDEFVKKLQNALAPYGLNVDIYGDCGTLQCPRDMQSDCFRMLERDYFIYLALENSFSEDYVTEKVLTALHHDVVPIVFGGANYSRFLPPDSYLDGRSLSPEQLAATMVDLINFRELYQQFFRWKRHYTFHNPAKNENVCSVCAALNNRSMIANSGYKDFRKWWNPNYKKRC